MSRSTGLFVTEAQCAERMGLTTEQFNLALPAARKAGFPSPDPLFANRRYWPAVKAWLDRRYDLNQVGDMTAPPGLDGPENWES
ncbi:winged helix-turn-helix domain-containing protein [Sinorhizobium meliloti]|nr:winged helix-turn-helix domain-containing protein [Sinorhizobium meliloti]RVP82048.1 winged helix-turn-helix domain-containing protein [Sinorhizobium meliloti]